MKKINRLVIAFVLSLVMSAPIYAGDILMGITNPPPAPPSASNGRNAAPQTDGSELTTDDAQRETDSVSEWVVHLLASFSAIF